MEVIFARLDDESLWFVATILMNTMANPYEAPKAIETSASHLPPQSGMLKASRPATVLLAMALANLSLTVFLFGSATILGRHFGLAPVEIGVLLLQFPFLVFITIAAMQMRSFRSHRLAYAGAILSCIPIISPFFILAVPVGFWALRSLDDPKVRACFADAR